MKLSDPFPPDKVKQKPGPSGRRLNFISHGLVTERLNEVDPGWTSEVIEEHTYKDAQGRLHCEGVTLRLTVNGVSRVEAGGPQRQDGFANEIKNAYSDALKRAAMRFGVALSMWESLIDSEHDEDYESGTLQAGTGALAPTRMDEGEREGPAVDMAMPGQVDALIRMANDLEMVLDDRVVADYNVGSVTMLTREQAGDLIVQLSKERTVHLAQLAMAREKRSESA